MKKVFPLSPKRYLLPVVFMLSLVFMMSGCANPLVELIKTAKTVPVAETQYLEATLIEGKTTKQEILDALGTPDTFTERSFYYGYSRPGAKAKVTVVHKDGTRMNVILGEGQHNGVSIGFSSKKPNILDRVRVR